MEIRITFDSQDFLYVTERIVTAFIYDEVMSVTRVIL